MTDTKKITADLHKWLAELATLKSKTSKLEAKVFANAYMWVEEVRKKNKGLSEIGKALKAFADTFKVSTVTATRYYHSGRFMVDNKLDSTIVDHRAVMLAKDAVGKMSKAGQLKTLDAVRKGEKRTKIATIVRHEVSKKLGVKTIKAVDKKPTVNQVRMEAMALLTLARRVFGEDASIEIKSAGRVRLRMGEK